MYSYMIELDNEAYWNAMDVVGDTDRVIFMYDIEGNEIGIILDDVSYELKEDLVDAGFLPEEIIYVGISNIVIVNKDIIKG